MVRDVLVGHLIINGADEAVEVRMQAVGIGKSFEMKPETLYRIEKRAVFGQPDQEDAVFQGSDSRLYSFAFVIRGIVQDQNEALVRIGSEGKMLQESNERFAVFVAVLSPGDLSGTPVVSTKEMGVERCAGRGNALALPTFRPAAAQWRMQT